MKHLHTAPTPSISNTIRSLMGQHHRRPLCAYLYDLEALTGHLHDMRHYLPPFCDLFYAVKANSAIPLLDTIAPLCDGFEVASGGELTHVRHHHPHAKILFGGPGKLKKELESALSPSIESLHVEGLYELKTISTLAEARQQPASIMLRLNLPREGGEATRLVMSGAPSPFGLDEADLQHALTLIKQTPWLSLEGVHIHAQSHQCDTNAHIAMLRGFLRRINRLEYLLDFHVPIINFGGGMGVAYQPPHDHFRWPQFCQSLHDIPDHERKGRRFRFEIGRFITAFCGTYAMEVLDIKQSYGEWFAIACGGTHHFRLPPAQGHSHPVHVVRSPGPPSLTQQLVTLTGQLCTPKDILARRTKIEALARGDVLLFPMAGAYGWSISHHDFLMHEPPQHIFLHNGQIREETP